VIKRRASEIEEEDLKMNKASSTPLTSFFSFDKND